MTRSHWIMLRTGSALLLAILIAALLLAIHIAAAYADDPNFAAIDDPLNGQWLLTPVTDLILYQSHPVQVNGVTKSDNLVYLLDTEYPHVITQTARLVVDPPCWLPDQREPQITRAGRFFALDHDVLVTLSPSVNAGGSDCASTNGFANFGLYVMDPKTSDVYWTHVEFGPYDTAMAMNDFNEDGFEDVFLINNTEAFVATAKDVSDPSAGMVQAARTELGSTMLAPLWDPVSADFNDDGLMDVAWIGQDHTLYFASVCPGSVPGTACDGKQALDVVLNPLNSRKNVITPPDANCWATGTTASPGLGQALAAGNFFVDTSESSEQYGRLVALGCVLENTTLRAVSYKFAGDMTVTQQQSIVFDSGYDYAGSIYAEGARLVWNSEQDQVVYAFAAYADGNGQWWEDDWVGVFSFDGVNMTNPGPLEFAYTQNQDGPYGILGLAAGHFAAIPDNADSSDYNLQIAVVRNSSPDILLNIFTVDPSNNYAVKYEDPQALDSSLGIANQDSPFNKLIAADLQGRSMRLGPPTVIRVDKHSQPSIILDAPPMHVDYVQPDESTATKWQVINFSAAPDSYNGTYSLSDTTTSQSSTTNTSSYSYAYSESAEEKFQLKVPLVSSISGDLKQAWEQKGESTTEQYAFTQGGTSFSAATTTGLEDVLWWEKNDFNVYFYPVLGQTVTVTDTQGMTTTQPLFVSVSGPSNTDISLPTTADTVEWYQPVHETGQVFSYPWTLQQLEQQSPGAQLLTSGTEAFYTDDSGTTESASWSQNQGTSQTTGSSHTHSFETDNSISAGNIPEEGSGFEVTGSFDYNNSTAVSNLNQSSTSLGQSEGVTIDKPKFPNDSLYKYLVSPVIFGQAPGVPPVQTLDLKTDIQTSGPVHSAYWADPTDPNAGSWWTSDVSPYEQYIDVALNHPVRWSIDSTGSGLACVVGDCAIPAQPLPDDLWNSTFYHMRGLLVTVGGFNGPQRVQASVGDDIFLQARVYNYSLKDMPAGSMIHARFYLQQIDGTTPTGNSVLIAEETADPLPGFNSSAHPGEPNWTTVRTSFPATSDMGDNYYIFWVLVWVEGNNGMVSELPGHGLTAMPGTLATIGDVPLEWVRITTADGNRQQTSFTNNVGMYKQTLHILASQSQAGTAEGKLSLAHVRVAVAPKLGKGMYLLTGDVEAAPGPASGVDVLAIRGDPEAAGARILDADVLPYISAGGSYAFSMPIRPAGCGREELVVVARTGAANRAQQIVSYTVPCGPPAPKPPSDAFTTTEQYLIQFYPRWFTYNQWRQSTHNRTAGPDRISPLYHTVVAINDDTLYASSVMELGAQPVVLTLPATPVTYSILALDPYGDVFDSGIPKQAGVYELTGPGFSGAAPPGVTQIPPMPLNTFFLIFRADKHTSSGENVIAQAEVFRSTIKMEPLCAYEGQPCPPDLPPGGSTLIVPEAAFAIPYKTVADDLIAKDPIAFLRELQEAVASPETPELSPSEQELSDHFNALFGSGDVGKNSEFAAGAQAGHQAILDNYLNGYLTNLEPHTQWIHFTNIGEWGDNALDRSAITEFIQYGNNIGAAAYYQTFNDESGKPLNGNNPQGYVLRFPKGTLPEAGRFWSITAYTPDAIELIPNPVNKYLIGDYTPGLQYDKDGSLSIYLSTELPAGVPVANWLPVQEGPFNIMLRVYGVVPGSDVANNTYVPPGVAKSRGKGK